MSDAPRWPGVDGSPGLDFSFDRDATGGDLYRDGESASSASSATSIDMSTPTSPDSPTEHDDASAEETTAISAGNERNQSAVEWASRPLGTTVPAPVRPVRRSASSAASSASAPVVPMSAESADGATTAAAPLRTGTRRTRKARLRLARIDPWSVMKTTFLFSIGFGVMLIVIVYVLWAIILGSGALEAVDSFVTTLIGDQSDAGAFRVQDYIGGSRIVGFAAVLAAIDVVIITAVSTLFAFLYNLAATIMGGLEVTLAED